MNRQVLGVGWHDVDWGNAPTWVSLLAALIAAGISLRNLRVDRQERRQQQAALVAGWHGAQERSKFRTLGQPPDTLVGVYLRNASSLPVYDLQVRMAYTPRALESVSDAAAEELSGLAPNDEPTFVVLDSSRPREHDGEWKVSVAFRDAQGRRWLRRGDGVLEKQPKRGRHGRHAE